MGSIRISHITGRFTISQPGFEPQNAPEPGDSPVVSMVNRSGILQRIHGDDGSTDWTVRVFQSRRPVVTQDAETIYDDEPRQRLPSLGYHYVVEVAHRKVTPAEECQQWTDILVAIQDRIRWLYEQSGVYYVAVFADMLGNGIHTPCMQIATFQALPPSIQDEVQASDAASLQQGVCNICQIIKNISGDERLVLQTKNFVAFCPWAPSCQYEFWIAPKRHVSGLLQTSQKEMDDLGMMMRATLGGVVRVTGGGPLSIAFHLSPETKNTNRVHWHIEVYPESRPSTALERGFGVMVNNTYPEEDAGRIRAAAREEMAVIMGVE